LFQNKYHSTFFKSIPKLTLYTQLFCFVYTTSIRSIRPSNLVRESVLSSSGYSPLRSQLRGLYTQLSTHYNLIIHLRGRCANSILLIKTCSVQFSISTINNDNL
jgi:hypothetical protein